MKHIRTIMYVVILIAIVTITFGIRNILNTKNGKLKEEPYIVQGMVNPLKWPDIMMTPAVEGDKAYFNKKNLQSFIKDASHKDYAVMMVNSDNAIYYLNFIPEGQKGVTSDFTVIRDNVTSNKYEMTLYFKDDNLVYVKATAVQ